MKQFIETVSQNYIFSFLYNYFITNTETSNFCLLFSLSIFLYLKFLSLCPLYDLVFRLICENRKLYPFCLFLQYYCSSWEFKYCIKQEIWEWTALSYFWFTGNTLRLFPLFSKMLAVDFMYTTLIMLRCVPISLDSLWILSWKDVGFLSKTFSIYKEIIVWFLCLIWLYDILHLLIFVWRTFPASLELSRIDCGGYIFHMLLNLVYKYFIEKFCVYVHQRNYPVILFLVVIESTTITLLNRNRIKPILGDLSLCPYFSASINPHLRNFILQVVINEEINKFT